MAKTYYVLVTRYESDEPWAVEFGAWDRDDVQYEADACKQNGVATRDQKIITCNGTQAAIDAIVAAMNKADAVAKANKA